LEFLLESSPLATAIIDRDRIVEVANPAFHELATSPETTGMSLRQAVPQLHEQLAPLVAAALDDDSASVNQELVIDVPASDPRAVHTARSAPPNRKTWLVNVYPVRAENGDTMGAGVVLADLTSERQLEAQYRQAQRLESLGRLTGGIAHDFNNILTVIVGFGEMAARDVADSIESGHPVDRHASEDLVQVQLAADRASVLTRQLLAYGRQQVLHPESLAITAVVHEVETMLRRVIGEDVQLVTRLPAAIWPVRADRSQVEQILMNLSVNARDAMPEGGQLVIEVRNVELDAEYARHHVGTSAGPHVVLAISDTGVGMDSATAARAFEPWFTTKPAGRGTGLGLATVYGIVKQSGGSIELYSELGHGTTFKLYLPRDADADAPALDAAAPRSSPTVPATRGARILVVEDDPAVALLAREVLASDGHAVVVAKSGREALQLLDADPGFDLVVTDMVMPELGGRALADELQRRGVSTKILFMSGYAAEAVSQRTVLPADAVFLEKPFRGAELLDTVRQLLRQP
jgi:signal transduction histidine kinase